MANYKIVNADTLDGNLTLIANGIRSLGLTSDLLTFPEEMADALAYAAATGVYIIQPGDYVFNNDMIFVNTEPLSYPLNFTCQVLYDELMFDNAVDVDDSIEGSLPDATIKYYYNGASTEVYNAVSGWVDDKYRYITVREKCNVSKDYFLTFMINTVYTVYDNVTTFDGLTSIKPSTFIGRALSFDLEYEYDGVSDPIGMYPPGDVSALQPIINVAIGSASNPYVTFKSANYEYKWTSETGWETYYDGEYVGDTPDDPIHVKDFQFYNCTIPTIFAYWITANRDGESATVNFDGTYEIVPDVNTSFGQYPHSESLPGWGENIMYSAQGDNIVTIEIGTIDNPVITFAGYDHSYTWNQNDGWKRDDESINEAIFTFADCAISMYLATWILGNMKTVTSYEDEAISLYTLNGTRLFPWDKYNEFVENVAPKNIIHFTGMSGCKITNRNGSETNVTTFYADNTKVSYQDYNMKIRNVYFSSTNGTKYYVNEPSNAIRFVEFNSVLMTNRMYNYIIDNTDSVVIVDGGGDLEFTINGTIYLAPEGITWAEFYGDTPAAPLMIIDDAYFDQAEQWYLCDESGVIVHTGDTITAQNYSWTYNYTQISSGSYERTGTPPESDGDYSANLSFTSNGQSFESISMAGYGTYETYYDDLLVFSTEMGDAINPQHSYITFVDTQIVSTEFYNAFTTAFTKL